MPSKKYRARLAANPSKSWPDQVILDGPAFAEQIRELLADLAFSIVAGDTRAASWGDYIVALGNLTAAEREGVDEVSLEYLADAVSVAWDHLAEDLDMSLFLKVADARLVAHLIDDVAGRVGTVKP